jgi:hypothetical protein
MARKDDDPKVDTDEYDVEEVTPETESVTATDPAGNPVEIAIPPAQVGDIIAEQETRGTPDEDVVEGDLGDDD